MISWSWLIQSLLGRCLKTFCALHWFVLHYILIFPSLNSTTANFKDFGGIQYPFLYLYHLKTCWNTVVELFFVTGTPWYSLWSYVLFGKTTFFTSVLAQHCWLYCHIVCHSDQHTEFLTFFGLFICYFHLLFLGLGFQYLVVVPGQVLCTGCMLPYCYPHSLQNGLSVVR